MTNDKLREAIEAIEPWANAMDQTGGPGLHLHTLIAAAKHSMEAPGTSYAWKSGYAQAREEDQMAQRFCPYCNPCLHNGSEKCRAPDSPGTLAVGDDKLREALAFVDEWIANTDKHPEAFELLRQHLTALREAGNAALAASVEAPEYQLTPEGERMMTRALFKSAKVIAPVEAEPVAWQALALELKELTEAFDLVSIDHDDDGETAEKLASYVSANLRTIIAAINHFRIRAHPAEQGKKPTPLLFDNEWLRARIAKDSDDEPTAGGYPRCNAILYPDGHCPACEARTDAAEQGKDAEDAARWIEDSEHYGHREWCKAVYGPTPENWYKHDQCDCGRNAVLAAARNAKPAKGG